MANVPGRRHCREKVTKNVKEMNVTEIKLNDLFGRIPRRHSTDNVKEMYSIIDDYEDALLQIEAENEQLEKTTAVYFNTLDPIRSAIRKSTDNKASKKAKDDFFAAAADDLKDSVQGLMEMYAESKTP